MADAQSVKPILVSLVTRLIRFTSRRPENERLHLCGLFTFGHAGRKAKRTKIARHRWLSAHLNRDMLCRGTFMTIVALHTRGRL